VNEVSMKWKKLGLVFCPEGIHPWMNSHAANTCVEHLQDDIFRFYFSCRDAQQHAHIGYADIDINPPFKVKAIADKPVLAPGQIGTFDDSGVSLSCIKNVRGKKFLYYLGWNLGVTVPWRNSIGLAILNEGTGNFERNSLAPLLDRNDVDPYSISYPFVYEENGKFHMWYGSNLQWGSKQEEMAHLIKYATSNDAIHWNREGKIALNFKNENEYAISRPYVLKDGELYKMWYSYRGAAYRIGYAESTNLIDWVRKDELVGIDVSPSGWDSEMICYPFIFEHKGRRYMCHNGNAYGKTGFGLAVLEEE
jgi:predicted GH43/DUF377 family glycosyl hydrolase